MEVAAPLTGAKSMNWDSYEGIRLLFDQLRSKLDARTLNEFRSLPPIDSPMAVILGVGPADSSALFSHLMQHPNTMPGVTREAMVFRAENEEAISAHSFQHILFYAHQHATNRLEMSTVEERQSVTRYLEFARRCHRFALDLVGGDFPMMGSVAAIDQDMSFTRDGAPAALHRFNADAKLLLVLRDPVEHAYSIYQRSKAAFVEVAKDAKCAPVLPGEKPKSFEQILRTDERAKGLYVGADLYAYYLKQWLQVFPREQMLIISSAQLRENQKETLERVFDFIGLEPTAIPPEGFVLPRDVIAEEYVTKDPMQPATRAALAEIFRPHNEDLFRLIGMHFNWAGVKSGEQAETTQVA